MNEVPARTSNSAIACLVLGLASLLCLGLLAGIPAVIYGHMLLSKMNKDSLLPGRGMVIAGLILGYLGIAWSILIIIPIILGQTAASFIYTLF